LAKSSVRVFQKTLRLPAYPRGFHLITRLVERELADELAHLRVGVLHVFIQHTSASLSLNENADPTVRQDFESHFNRMVPENAPYRHDDEGPDDMPAHLKAALLGHAVTVPITHGRLNLGTWQGIYLGEHRNHGDPRTLVLTAWGE
jgi:secondary thiamine-phosphate synthase enzyme